MKKKKNGKHLHYSVIMAWFSHKEKALIGYNKWYGGKKKQFEIINWVSMEMRYPMRVVHFMTKRPTQAIFYGDWGYYNI